MESADYILLKHKPLLWWVMIFAPPPLSSNHSYAPDFMRTRFQEIIRQRLLLELISVRLQILAVQGRKKSWMVWGVGGWGVVNIYKKRKIWGNTKTAGGTQFNVENPKCLCLKCSLKKDCAANMCMCELCVCWWQLKKILYIWYWFRQNGII